MLIEMEKKTKNRLKCYKNKYKNIFGSLNIKEKSLIYKNIISQYFVMAI